MSSFNGIGVQNSGPGNFIAGDITITGSSAQEKAEEKLNCLLRDLRVIDYRDAKAYIQDMKGSPLPAAYEWILEHDTFLHWRDDTQGRVLMITGGPGKGKTMLLCGVIDHLNVQKTEEQPMAYFFCEESDTRLSNGTAVLRGLVHTLLCQYPNLVSHIQKDYDRAGKALFEGREAFESISRILTNMLRDPVLDNVILIIDALDECVIKRQQLLAYIRRVQATSSPRSRWLISSRDFPGLDDELNSSPSYFAIPLELNDAAVTSAVQSYIDYKVDWLSTLKAYDSRTHEVVARYLSENANRTFLWVALACEELSHPDTLHFEIEEKLKTLPPGLESLYDGILKHLCKSKHAMLCLKILATIARVVRPVSMTELACITDLPINVRQDPRSVKSLIKICSSFLILRGNIIHLVHQSAKEFMYGIAASRIFPLGGLPVHRSLFRASLAAMTTGLTRDVYRLARPNVSIDDIAVSSTEQDPLPPIRYACFHWIEHLIIVLKAVETESEIVEDLEETAKFLSTKCLPWLEAMILQRSLTTAIYSLRILLSFRSMWSAMSTTQARSTWALLDDASRFASYHKSVIEKLPLQLYVSALVFSPTKSYIRQLYEKPKEPWWIECKPAMEPYWNSCFQTFEGHNGTVTSVALCPRRNRMASASEDKTVKIWQAPVASCLLTLEGHESDVTTVSFSNDGLTVASGSLDGTIKIWNVADGELRQGLSHCYSVSSVAFSPDDKQLVSAGHDGTVKVWGLSEPSGECLQTLHHPEPVISFVFARTKEGQLLTGCGDGVVRNWDLTSGTSTTLSMFHGDLLTVSRDGSIVAAVCPGRAVVRALNVRTRVNSMAYRGEDWDIESVALSDNGKLIAIGTSTAIIKVIDTTSGSCLQTLQGHGGRVSAVLFLDNQNILSGSNQDKVIMAWRIDPQNYKSTFDRHTSFIFAVACSSDGLMAASGSGDKTAKLWTTTDGKCEHTLRGHDDTVLSVAFSGDNKKLATGSSDNLVKIWDVSSGNYVRTLRGHNNEVEAVAFSLHGQFVVSGSSDLSVKLWDAIEGTCLQTLHGHNNPICSVAISADSHLVASADEKTIKIWDASTGICTQALIVDKQEKGLYFATETNTRLYTNRSIHNLEQEEITTEPVPCVFEEEENLIAIRGTDKVVWLPAEYMALERAYAKSTVVLGCASGRVLCIKFKMEAP